MSAPGHAPVRLFAASVAAFVVVGVLVASPAGARRAAGDPCAVGSGPINAAFGATSDTPEFGTPGSQKSHGLTAKTCTWTYASAKLIVAYAPKAYKPPAWPAGTKTAKASGFGAAGKLMTNPRAGAHFVAVTFTKGSTWVEVWVANGGGGQAKVVSLAKSVYAKA